MASVSSLIRFGSRRNGRAMGARVGLDRTQVVDSATGLLEERGRVEDVALREVADRLGVRTQSLYAHVDGIDGLRRQLGLRGLEAMADRLGAAAMGRTRGDAVAAIVLAWATFALDHPGLYGASLRPP